MASSVLREFLIRIKYSIDEAEKKKFSEGLETTAKNLMNLGKQFAEFSVAVIAAGTAATAAIVEMAKPLEYLYYQSQLTRASVQGLDEWSTAAQRVGVSAEAAEAQISSLAEAQRNNPGTNQYLKNLLGLGSADELKKMDTAAVAYKALLALQKLPQRQAIMEAKFRFGWSEDAFLLESENLTDMQKAITRRAAAIKNSGVDFKQLAIDARNFNNTVGDTVTDLGLLKDRMLERFFPGGTDFLKKLDRWINALISADKASGGLLSTIGDLVVALVGVSTALNALGTMTGLFKLIGLMRGGATAAAAAGATQAVATTAAASAGTVAAEAGGAALAGEGVLATGGIAAAAAGLMPVLLPIILAAGTIAAIVYAVTHWQQIKDSAHSEADWTDKQIGKAYDWAKEKVEGVRGAVKNSYDGGDLGKWIAAFEGFRKKVYQDAGGNETIGYGHRVLGWESFGGGIDEQTGRKMLNKDLQTAIDAVHRLVKVHLNKYQEAAVTDLAFNLGESKFKSSSLLKDLNANNFAAVAANFEHYNKVLTDGHYVANQGLANRRAAEAAAFSRQDSGTTIHAPQTNNINVEASRDPVATGHEILRQQKHANSDHVRNLTSAYQY